MRKSFIALSMLAIAGCSTTVQTGSQGITSDGSFVAGDLTYDNMAQSGAASIVSPEGWTCSAPVSKGTTGAKVRVFPASCSNGDSGTFVLSGNDQAQTIGLTFNLASGRSGQVVFGG